MNTINPDKAMAQAIKCRADAIALMHIHTDMLQRQFFIRREVNHDIVRKLTNELLKLVMTLRPDGEAPDRLEQIMRGCEADRAGSPAVIHRDSTGRIYLEGYFDISKLHKSLLW